MDCGRGTSDGSDQYLCFPVQYFRMELLHAEKLRKEQKELELAKMDLVSTHTHTHVAAFLSFQLPRPKVDRGGGGLYCQ